MEKNLLAGLLLLFAMGAAAQHTNRVAITGGLHSARVSSSWNPHPLASDSHTIARTGARLGLIASIPFSPKSKFRFQPGIIFSAKGATQTQMLDTGKTKVLRLSDKQFTNYIDAPLNLVAALPLSKKARFIVGGGPQFSLFYNGRKEFTSFDTLGRFSFTEVADVPVGQDPGKYKVVHLAVNALAGFELGRVFFTANYGQSLTPYLAQNNKEFKHTTMGATLGIYFGPQPGDKKKPKKVLPPKDKDKDGIPDPEDLCPDIAGSLLTKGCPDSDGDGIADPLDHCPGRKGPAENNGCPLPDRDNDGVPDKQDKCPDHPGVAKYNGCPVPDSDNDGVNDEQDKCPQVAGAKENGGCPVATKAPEVKKEVVEKVNTAARQIAFALGKAELLSFSLPVLDDLAKLMQQHPELKLTIEGHTSADGNAAVNQVLSEQRAQTVKTYLVSKGVASSRITAVGFGATRPLNKGTSKAEQAANRRVELILSY